MNKLICCLMLLTSLWTSSMAQGVVVTGKITDVKTHEPLIGVSIAEVDHDNRTIGGVVTNIDGNFSLKIVHTSDRLKISAIGYKTVTLEIGTRTNFTMGLSAATNTINQVTIVAQQDVSNGMLPIPKRDITTAISTIDAKEMEEMQAPSIDLALQGRMPGVDIAANSGDPGAGLQIRIRGTSSINASDNPLIVVDGMPYETEIPSDFNFGTADEQGYATLLNIAPADIKDITILKDAAATAVWGSRAASGVLIINTKRGTKGKPNLTYTFKGSLSLKPKPIPMLNGNEYSTLIPEEYMNRNGIPLNTQTVNEFNYDPNDPYWYYNYSNNTDWIGAISQNGFIQDHDLSMRGGGDKAMYYISLDYLNQTGTTVGTNLNRITTRVNLDYNISERIKIRTDLSFANTSNDRSYTEALRNVAYIKMPNMSIREFDEYGNQTPNYFSPESNIQGQYSGTYNPVAMAMAARNNIVMQRVIPQFQVEYTIKPDVLTAKSNVQFDINNTKNKKFLPQIATGRPWTETSVNQAYDGDNDAFNVQTKTDLIFTPRFKNTDHSLISLLDVMTYDNKRTSYQAQTSNTASSELQDPSIPSRDNGSASNLKATTSETRTASALLNAQYSYLDRYIVNVGLRGDGNSRLAPKSRYGLFPSISTRWRISGEPFMQPYADKVDELSLRASYGRSGNAPGSDYIFYNNYQDFDWSYLGNGAVYPSTMALNNLKWETVVGANAGVNLSMYDRRITLDMEFYRKRTKDLLFNGLEISSVNGYNDVEMNVGTLDNQGWELDLNTIPVRNKDWEIDFNFNIARNVNIIRKISEFFPVEEGNVTANGEYKTYMQVNNPFGSFYGFRYKGVYKNDDETVARDADGKAIVSPTGEQVHMRFDYPAIGYIFQPGDAKYEDINHDGNIDYRDIVYLGNSNPLFTGGFGINVAYKGRLRLSTFFNFRYDYDIVDQTMMMSTNMYGYDNQSTAVLKRWRQVGDVTDMPRALFQSGYNWLGSDRYVKDGSFLRFRTATLRYTFSKEQMDRMKIKNLSCYLTVENLYTWTRYTGQDPEVSVRGSDPFRVAMDNSRTPPVKTFTIGLTGSF